MLWSKTIVDADSACPSQGIGLRAGRKGRSWDGYRVGSYVHDAIHAEATGEEAPDRSGLTITELVAADRLMINYRSLDTGVPEDAVFEESMIAKLDASGDAPDGWDVAPDWAIRGEKWDPSRADGTYFRIQPDAYFFDPEDSNVLVVLDWKTSWGIPSDSNLEKDTQSIVYSAAMAQRFPQAVRFVWWNIRYKTGQMCERTSEEWIAMAKPIWAACHERDTVREWDLERDTRAGEHCGRCPYSGDCLGVASDHDNFRDDELYRYSKRLDALARVVKTTMGARLKARTTPLGLAPDLSVVPENKTYPRWKKGRKERALRELFVLSQEMDDMDPFDYFDIKGPLGSWVDSLPDAVSEKVRDSLSQSNRQLFVEKKEGE